MHVTTHTCCMNTLTQGNVKVNVSLNITKARLSMCLCFLSVCINVCVCVHTYVYVYVCVGVSKIVHSPVCIYKISYSYCSSGFIGVVGVCCTCMYVCLRTVMLLMLQTTEFICKHCNRNPIYNRRQMSLCILYRCTSTVRLKHIYAHTQIV